MAVNNDPLLSNSTYSVGSVISYVNAHKSKVASCVLSYFCYYALWGAVFGGVAGYLLAVPSLVSVLEIGVLFGGMVGCARAVVVLSREIEWFLWQEKALWPEEVSRSISTLQIKFSLRKPLEVLCFLEEATTILIKHCGLEETISSMRSYESPYSLEVSFFGVTTPGDVAVYKANEMTEYIDKRDHSEKYGNTQTPSKPSIDGEKILFPSPNRNANCTLANLRYAFFRTSLLIAALEQETPSLELWKFTWFLQRTSSFLRSFFPSSFVRTEDFY